MKGMIFDGESVRQILAGNKTQSRRIMKPQPVYIDHPYNFWVSHDAVLSENDEYVAKHFARYKAGETVYVKEAYRVFGGDVPITRYKADGTSSSHWQTPLFMPESLSRIKLQIVRVGIERVHDISIDDCIKEGIVNSISLWFDWGKRWIEVNGQASWDSNPWVWVYEFVRV